MILKIRLEKILNQFDSKIQIPNNRIQIDNSFPTHKRLKALKEWEGGKELLIE